MALIVEVPSQGTQADVITYSAATSAFVKSTQRQHWAAVRGMTVEGRSQGQQADVITYIAAISAENSAQRQRFVKLIIEMRSQGLQADVISCSADISASVKSTQLRASRSRSLKFARRVCRQT